MCTGWCPLAADWGNWADWAQFAAAVVVGIAVWRVSSRTNELAEAANKTNETLLRLEAAREMDAVQLRAAERRLLLVSMAMPLRTARATAGSFVETIGDDSVRDDAINKIDSIRQLENLFEIGKLRIGEDLRSRLHFLDESTAARLLRIESGFNFCCTLIKTMPDCTQDIRRGSLAKIYLALRDTLPLIDAVDAECTSACEATGVPRVKLGPYKLPPPPTWYPNLKPQAAPAPEPIAPE